MGYRLMVAEIAARLSLGVTPPVKDDGRHAFTVPLIVINESKNVEPPVMTAATRIVLGGSRADLG